MPDRYGKAFAVFVSLAIACGVVALSNSLTHANDGSCPIGLMGYGRCYEVRYELFSTPSVIQVDFKFDGWTEQCLGQPTPTPAPTTSHDFGNPMSLAAVWLNGVPVPGDGVPPGDVPWVEFGSQRTSNGYHCPADAEPAKFYSFCGNCYTLSVPPPGPSSRNGYMYHGKADSASIVLRYQQGVSSVDNSAILVNRWVWSIDGEDVRVAENPSMGMADIVRIGGESTSIMNGMGRYIFSEITRHVDTGSGIVKGEWKPSDARALVGSGAGRYRGSRYFSYYLNRISSAGKQYNGGWRKPALLEIFADDDVPGLGSQHCNLSSCNPTPTPSTSTPTALDTMEPLGTPTPVTPTATHPPPTKTPAGTFTPTY